MTMITPSYLGETIEYSSLHACRSTLEDPTNVYLAAVGATAPEDDNSTDTDRINVYRSTNGGVSFAAPTDAMPIPALPFDGFDKPSVAVDTFSGSTKGEGNVYAAAVQFISGFGDETADAIVFTRSTDGGNSFDVNNPIIINIPSSGYQENGPSITVGADHKVYLAWREVNTNVSPNTFVTKVEISDDQGVSFGSPITMVSTSFDVNSSSEGFDLNSWPIIKANPNPADANQLYAVYTDFAPNTTTPKVYFIESIDGGHTWTGANSNSAPTQLNIDTSSTDAQFNPAIAVTPDGSEVFVGYYDLVSGLISTWDTIGDVTGLGPEFAAPLQVSTTSSPPVYRQEPQLRATYMGDYDLADADNDNFYYTWSDSRDGNPNVYFAKVPVPAPTITPTPIFRQSDPRNNGTIYFVTRGFTDNGTQNYLLVYSADSLADANAISTSHGVVPAGDSLLAPLLLSSLSYVTILGDTNTSTTVIVDYGQGDPLAFGTTNQLVFQGVSSSGVLYVQNDPRSNQTYTLTNSSVASGSENISYSNVTTINLIAGPASGTSSTGDTVNVLSTGSSTIDNIQVTSSGAAVRMGDASNALAGILGIVSVAGLANDATALVVDDSSDKTFAAYTVTSDSVGLFGHIGISYSQIHALTLTTGSDASPSTPSNDLVSMISTSSYPQSTTAIVVSGRGAQVDVGDIANKLGLIGDPVTVTGFAGDATTLNVNDASGNTSPSNYELTSSAVGLTSNPIAYSNIRTVNLTTGTGSNDVVKVLSTPNVPFSSARVTITGAGAQVNVGDSLNPLSNVVNQLTIVGLSGDATGLNLDDSGGTTATLYQISSTEVDPSATNAIKYSNINSISLTTNAAANEVVINSTPPVLTVNNYSTFSSSVTNSAVTNVSGTTLNTTTVLNIDGPGQTVNVGTLLTAIAGALNVAGATNSTTVLNISDIADITYGAIYNVTSSSLQLASVTGLPAISYFHVNSLNLITGNDVDANTPSADTVTVSSTASVLAWNTPVSITVSGRRGQVNIGDSTVGLNQIADPINIIGRPSTVTTLPADLTALNIDDHASSNARTYTMTSSTVQATSVVTYSHIHALSLTTSQAQSGDVVNVPSWLSELYTSTSTINVRGGNTQVIVGRAGSVYSLADAQSTLAVNGLAHDTTSLLLYDLNSSAGAQRYDITSTVVYAYTNPQPQSNIKSFYISYANINALSLYTANAVGDTVTLESTPPNLTLYNYSSGYGAPDAGITNVWTTAVNTTTTIFMQSGPQTLNVGTGDMTAIAGTLNVMAQGGLDTMNITDTDSQSTGGTVNFFNATTQNGEPANSVQLNVSQYDNSGLISYHGLYQMVLATECPSIQLGENTTLVALSGAVTTTIELQQSAAESQQGNNYPHAVEVEVTPTSTGNLTVTADQVSVWMYVGSLSFVGASEFDGGDLANTIYFELRPVNGALPTFLTTPVINGGVVIGSDGGEGGGSPPSYTTTLDIERDTILTGNVGWVATATSSDGLNGYITLTWNGASVVIADYTDVLLSDIDLES